MKILKFYAEWCGPCKQLSKTIEEFKKLHPDIEIQEIDVDDDTKEALIDKYNIGNVPVLIKLENDKEVGRKTGAISLNELEQFILNKE